MKRLLFVIFILFFSSYFSDSFAGKLREKQIIEDNSPQGSFSPGLSGEKLYKDKLCYTCHGDEGKIPIMELYPKLNGQKNTYLLQQITDIKNGTRNNGMSSVMTAMTKDLKNNEIKAISNYLSRLSYENENKKSMKSTYNGKLLYKSKMCHTCHGPNGKNSISDNYPRLAGQNESYLIRQLLDMKNKKRINGMSNAMIPFLGMVNEEELKEISGYLSSL